MVDTGITRDFARPHIAHRPRIRRSVAIRIAAVVAAGLLTLIGAGAVLENADTSQPIPAGAWDR